MTHTQDSAPRCETCRFAHINWRKGDQYEFVASVFSSNPPTMATREATSVQCRRHAPRKAALENDMDGWPWVQGDDWCGEHSPRATLRTDEGDET